MGAKQVDILDIREREQCEENIHVLRSVLECFDRWGSTTALAVLADTSAMELCGYVQKSQLTGRD